MKALVLSGGGARGAYEAGAVCGLVDAGEKFDLVCGTSIGAVNASFLAQDLTLDLEQLWKSIAARNIIRLTPQAQHVEDFIDGFEAFLKLDPLERAGDIPHLIDLYARIGSKVALLSLLGVMDRSPITGILNGKPNANNLKRSLIITATDITQEMSEWFYAFVGTANVPDVTSCQSNFLARIGPGSHPLSNENFLVAVEASASIPLAFPPVVLNQGADREFLYVDGGVANNTPIGLAIDAGATDVTVIFMDPVAGAPPYQAIPNAAVLGMACYDVVQQKILADDMKLAVMTNKAVALGLDEKVEVTLREVRPKLPLDLTVLGFSDQQKLTEAFDLGHADAANITTVWPPA